MLSISTAEHKHIIVQQRRRFILLPAKRSSGSQWTWLLWQREKSYRREQVVGSL